MLLLKVFVVELLAVDALTARAIALGEITTLDHELLDHAVELAALVVERLAGLAQALLTGAESAKVLGSLGHDVVVQLECDATGGLVADLDVEEDLAALCSVGHCGGTCFGLLGIKGAVGARS
jgi:hypothetical protein